MRATLPAGTTLFYCPAFFGAAVVHHGTRAANPPWQSLSPVEIEVLRQVSRNEQEIQRAELLEQKARTLTEFRSGMICSECKRSASEIERNRSAPAPLAAIGSFRGNSRPPPAVDEDSLLGDVLENSLFSAVGQATSRRFPSPTRSLQDGLFGTLTDRVENRAGDWIRSQPWFRGRSLNDAPAEERDEREFLYSGTKSLLNLLSRNVQGAVNAGRDAVEAGIARPLQRFSEDELFKP